MRYRLALVLGLALLAAACWLTPKPKLPPLCGKEQFPDMHRCRVFAEGEKE